MIFRDTQTDKHFIIIYISSSPPSSGIYRSFPTLILAQLWKPTSILWDRKTTSGPAPKLSLVFWGREKRRKRRGGPGSALKEGNFGSRGTVGAESTPDPNTRPIHHLMPVTTRKLRSRYFRPDQELHEKRFGFFCLIFDFNIFELIKTDMKIILHIQYQNLKIEHRAIIGTVDQIFPSHLIPTTWKCRSRSNITEWRLQATVVQARDQGSNYQRGKATPADTVAGKCLKTA